LANDLDMSHVDQQVIDLKPDTIRFFASMRITHLCASLQQKMFKDHCVLFPDDSTKNIYLNHAKDSFSFDDLKYHFRKNESMLSHLTTLGLNSPAEFADTESFEKLAQELAADVGELSSRLQDDHKYEELEKRLIKLHMCSSASHHSKQVDFEICMDTIMKIQTVTLQSIIKNMPPQPQLALSSYSTVNFAERHDIRVAFVSCLLLSLFDIFVVLTLPLALLRYRLLGLAFQSSRAVGSSRAFMYCAFRISFRVFLDGVLLLCSIVILLSVVMTLPFFSRMHDAWKSKSLSYARNIIIVILRDFAKSFVRNFLFCGSYNFGVLFWSLFLVGFWSGFLPAMIVYVAASNIDFLKNHKLLGCFFSLSFWSSMIIIVPMYGLFINVASPKVVGSEFGSVVWFLIIMILISVVAAVHLSLNRDQSKPVFSAATQRLPIRKNFANAAALFDVLLDGIQ
jgi:hypothetical protein